MENERARRRMLEAEKVTAYMSEQRKLEQQRFENNKSEKPNNWLEAGLMVMRAINNNSSLKKLPNAFDMMGGAKSQLKSTFNGWNPMDKSKGKANRSKVRYCGNR